MKKMLLILVASVAFMAMANTASAQKTYHFWATVFSLEAGTPSSMPDGGLIVLKMQQYENPSDPYPGKTGEMMLNDCMEYLRNEGAPVRLHYFQIHNVANGTVYGTAVLQLYPGRYTTQAIIQFNNGTVRNY